MDKLENVKVGDKLKVYGRYDEQIEVVKRVTATLVITDYNRFNKKTGKAQGYDSWSHTWAVPATSEDIERISRRIKRQKLEGTCRNIRFECLTDSQLEAILEIVNTNND